MTETLSMNGFVELDELEMMEIDGGFTLSREMGKAIGNAIGYVSGVVTGRDQRKLDDYYEKVKEDADRYRNGGVYFTR